LQRLEEILREDSSLSQLSGPTTDIPLPLGPRRISKLAIKSEVPPMLRPITSFENTFMVRILHRFSLFLEDKIYGPLPLSSSSSSFPPHLERIKDGDFEREVGVSTPLRRRRTGEETEEEDYSTASMPAAMLTSNRGEINLRFLADYRFQASFLALYLLLSLLWRLVVSPEEIF
jgi:hypothetical protein